MFLGTGALIMCGNLVARHVLCDVRMCSLIQCVIEGEREEEGRGWGECDSHTDVLG